MSSQNISLCLVTDLSSNLVVYDDVKCTYQDKHKLGSGTYANVYKVCVNDKQYAVKKTHTHIRMDSMLSVIIREPTITLWCKHPNIVNIDMIELKISNGIKMKMFMPLATCDLRSLIERDRIKILKNYKQYAFQLVDALMFCQNKGVFHRDIKTQNILYYEDKDCLKISDFGLARSHSCTKNYKNWTKLVYSLWYRAPEILLSSTITAKSEVWALGCVLYEMLTGKFLLSGNSETEVMKTIFKIFDGVDNNFWSLLNTNIIDHMKQKMEEFKKNCIFDVNIPEEFNSVEYSIEKHHNDGCFNRLKSLLAIELDKPELVDDNPNKMLDSIYFIDLLRSMLNINPVNRISMCDVYNHKFFSSVRKCKMWAKKDVHILDSIEMSILNPKNFHPQYQKNRSIIINWFIEIYNERRWTDISTLFMAVDLLDRSMLCLMDIPMSKYQLVAISCMCIASNYNDYNNIQIPEAVYCCDDCYKENEINEYIVKILKLLQFDLIRSNCADYMKSYNLTLQRSDKLYIGVLIYSLETNALFMFSQKKIAKACKYICDKFNKKDTLCVTQQIKDIAFYILTFENASFQDFGTVSIFKLKEAVLPL